MKRPSIFIRAISIILVLTFITGQVSASQILSSHSTDTLAASVVSDSNINPERSNAVRNDVAEKAEPGAIGNGIPLMNLAQGILPPRATLSSTSEEYKQMVVKLNQAITLAIKLSIENQGKVPLQHQARAKEAQANLIFLQNSLSINAYLYNAVVGGTEDYLIGFNYQTYRGLSVELIERLYGISSKRLAQYIYHECVPEKGIIKERDDHKVVYSEIQTAVFGEDEVLALKKDLRGFINEKAGLTKTITLKNGATEAEPLVNRTMLSIQTLMQHKPSVLYELVMKIRNPSRKFSGESEDDLKALSLVQQDGRIDDSVRNIVLSAYEGEGFADMRVVSPIKNNAELTVGKINPIITLPANGLEPFRKFWHYLMLPEDSKNYNVEQNFDKLAKMLDITESDKNAFRAWFEVFIDRTKSLWGLHPLGLLSRTSAREYALHMITEYEKTIAQREGIHEEKIGRFQNVREAWNKIVDLYNEGKIRWIVYVPQDIHDTLPIEQQYDGASGDVIAPRKANPIDHGGWTSIRVVKDKPHMTLMFVEGSVELFVDTHKDGSTVAKVVPISNPTEPTQKPSKEPVVLLAQLSEDLPVRAKVFAANLTRILAENPDQIFFMGIETDIGESQKAQIMPIYKAIDQIENLTDSNGKRLFPNLMVRRAKAGELVAMASDLSKEGKLNLNNTFIGARKVSVDDKAYDAIKGEGKAWISAIDDSSAGDYIPVFEAITLNMMAYLNADISAIKNFYDAISDKPIDPLILQDMIRNRIIYILPRATKFDTKQLRELYELARQVYIAA